MPGDEIAGSGFSLVPDDLTKHAASVERAADAIDRVASAGGQVTLGARAYGMIFHDAVTPLTVCQSQVVEAANDSAFALRSAADLLKETVYRFTIADESADQALSGASEGLSQ